MHFRPKSADAFTFSQLGDQDHFVSRNDQTVGPFNGIAAGASDTQLRSENEDLHQYYR